MHHYPFFRTLLFRAKQCWHRSAQAQTEQILACYATGERNFQGADLSGLSFKGKDLKGANFNGADIRGCNFSNAQLSHASFQGVRAGLQFYWQFLAMVSAVFWGFLAGFLSTRLSVPLVSSEPLKIATGVFSVSIAVCFCAIARRTGLLKGLIITLGITGSAGTLLGTLSVGFNSEQLGFALLDTFDSLILTLVVITTLCFLVAISQAITRHSQSVSRVCAITGAISVPTMTAGPIAENLGAVGTVIASIIALGIIQFCYQTAKASLAGDERHRLVHAFTVTVLSLFGTRFHQAQLTGTNFSNAQLQYTDFRAEAIDYTRWDSAQGLDQARWGSLAMAESATRQLMITRQATLPEKEKSAQENLVRATLAQANLAGMDLSNICFEGVDLTAVSLVSANLQGANLSHSNLKLVQALGTDFTGATMTGCCIEGWSIDSHTCFEAVACTYVYRLAQVTPAASDRDRLPSSGYFEPGDFTRLFQVLRNTVEIIFRHGVDRSALLKTLSQIQQQYEEKLSIQGVEDKGDGFIKVTVSVPEGVEKTAIHQEFKQFYQENLRKIEAQYQAHLQTAQQQIETHQSTITDLTTVLKQVTSQISRQTNTPLNSQTHRSDTLTSDHTQALTKGWVVLTFWDGSLAQGYPITADIHVGSLSLPFKFHASLPPAPELRQNYQQWQRLYRQTFRACSRIQFADAQEMTNISCQELSILATQLNNSLQSWLKSAAFRPIADKLREKFLPEQEIQILIQTEDIWLRRLPWHLWNFLDDYPNAGITLGGMALETKRPDSKKHSLTRVLAVLGNNAGIDVEVDRQLFQALDTTQVSVTFLQEPTRQTFHEYLWDSQGWDILYFSGHSYSQTSGNNGIMQLNPSDKISIEDLHFALKKAVNHGLQLAMLNSCDGLGLASMLARLKIPQIVVMKEPIPDEVAHSFLEYFLQALTQGSKFYAAFQEARQQLSGLEREYPYASWLPTLFQTTTAVPGLPHLAKAENVRQSDGCQQKF